jgi:hypothetical protein
VAVSLLRGREDTDTRYSPYLCPRYPWEASEVSPDQKLESVSVGTTQGALMDPPKVTRQNLARSLPRILLARTLYYLSPAARAVHRSAWRAVIAKFFTLRNALSLWYRTLGTLESRQTYSVEVCFMSSHSMILNLMDYTGIII